MPDRRFNLACLGVWQKSRKGSREIFKCCDVAGSDDDYSLTFVHPGLLNVCVLLHQCPACINRAFTHIRI